jgi:hypothetical protein
MDMHAALVQVHGSLNIPELLVRLVAIGMVGVLDGNILSFVEDKYGFKRVGDSTDGGAIANIPHLLAIHRVNSVLVVSQVRVLGLQLGFQDGNDFGHIGGTIMGLDAYQDIGGEIVDGRGQGGDVEGEVPVFVIGFELPAGGELQRESGGLVFIFAVGYAARIFSFVGIASDQKENQTGQDDSFKLHFSSFNNC